MEITELIRLAEQGNANAQSVLGLCYKSGYDVSQDYYKAFEWFKETAKQGDDAAKTALSVLGEL
jgi:TPR repeat protein